MTKETFWFRHDYDAADDDKTMLLIEQLGLEGYGIYWILIEKLRGRKDYKMPFSVVPSLARRYMTTPEKMKTVITQYGLFEYDDDGFFYSVSLIERMTALEDLKNKRSIAGKIGNQKRWGKETETPQLELFIANESQCDSNAIASYRDKNRIDKNIIKEKEDKSSKKKEDDDFVERMYKLYPTKCPKRGATLGKSHKDKDRIRKLLKRYSMEEIEKVFNHEIEEKYDKQYMQNFATFLNNFPDINALEQGSLFNDVPIESSRDSLIINGVCYK